MTAPLSFLDHCIAEALDRGDLRTAMKLAAQSERSPEYFDALAQVREIVSKGIGMADAEPLTDAEIEATVVAAMDRYGMNNTVWRGGTLVALRYVFRVGYAAALDDAAHAIDHQPFAGAKCIRDLRAKLK